MHSLHLTRHSAPSEVPPQVYAEVLRWMEEHDVEDIVLDANSQGYGILINPDADRIPVGLVSRDELEDARTLVEHLEMAWRVYLEGGNCTD
ncbi:hypothetical protein Mterra_02991 [Calidithermus terrae]|uniref:Uncharacterized protein n=1 Tax=Calidithermus terrae TaxID=1408545 RepID=A0A399EBL0_9DEIN|nr:hypothetical protein [Calidithermus terrae]RIH81735.1 hypothetical protein Mterra_02991 [Calidithermus terrae]